MGGLRLVDKWRRLGGVSIVNTIPGDCTAGVQAAINACNPGDTLYFPAGTYTISAPAPGTYSILSLPWGIKIEGDGVGETIIKVGNACPTYKWLLGPSAAGTDLTGLEIHDITFDHNIANNAITNAGEILAWPEYTCGTFAGTDINIYDLEVINASSQNNIVVNGVGVDNVTIDNIICSDIGDDPNHIVHDSSFIYTHCSDQTISNCNLSCASVGLPGGTTAIETHGTGQTVELNVITNFQKGMNITGISLLAADGLITQNNISGCWIGIDLWSEDYLTHVAGYGIDGMDITHNTINIEPYGGVGDTKEHGGIIFEYSLSLDVNDLLIDNNTVTVDSRESVAGGGNWRSCGIGCVAEVAVKTLSNVTVTNNTITNFPNNGIRFEGCDLDTVSVNYNTLIDCGSSLLAGLSDSYKAPILLNTDNIDTVDISDNLFIDDIAVTRIKNWMAFLTSVSSTGLTVGPNSYTMSGDEAVFVRQFDVQDDISQPLLTETIDGFVYPVHVVDDASTVIDGIYTWTVDVTGLIWSKLRTGDTLFSVSPDAHAETTSVDGQVRRGVNETWAQITAGAGDNADDSSVDGSAGGRSTANVNEFQRCWRSIFLFDTSPIPNGSVVDEAALKVYIPNKTNDLGWSNSQAALALVAAVPTTGDTVLVAADYGAFGSTRFATDIPYNLVSSGAYVTFNLNAAGLAAIDVTGITKFGIRIAADIDGTAPWVSNVATYFDFQFADNGADIPILEIQYH